MNTLKINRMNDFYFQYLLGSEQRKHLTIQFLNAVLYENEETQIEDVIFLDKDRVCQEFCVNFLEIFVIFFHQWAQPFIDEQLVPDHCPIGQAV